MLVATESDAAPAADGANAGRLPATFIARPHRRLVTRGDEWLCGAGFRNTAEPDKQFRRRTEVVQVSEFLARRTENLAYSAVHTDLVPLVPVKLAQMPAAFQ